MMEVQVQMVRLSPTSKDSPRKAHCVCVATRANMLSVAFRSRTMCLLKLEASATS